MTQPLDVLLTICPPWGVFHPPIGIATLAAYLADRGISVSCIDLNARLYRHAENGGASPAPWNPGNAYLWTTLRAPETLGPFAEPIAAFVDQARAAAPAVIGFSIYVDNVAASVEIARRVRTALPGAAIVFGGPWRPGDETDPAIDFDIVDAVVAGEGERQLERIAAWARQGGRGAIRENAAGPVLACDPLPDLDASPVPDYACLDLSLYAPGQISVIGSRSCPNHCRFCTDREYLGSYRVKSPERVVDEVTHAVEALERPYILFNDMVLNHDQGWLRAVCGGILDRRLAPRWSGFAVFREDLTPDLLALLKKAGCTDLQFGLESGSDTVLKAMRKPFRRALAARVLRNVHAAGIRTKINLIVGYPGETESDFADTLSFLRDNADVIDDVRDLIPFALRPGTGTWKDRESLGIEPADSHPEHWVSTDGNTPEVRVARGRRVLELCYYLDIPADPSAVEGLERSLTRSTPTEKNQDGGER